MKRGAHPRFFVNADGLGADAGLRIELLDHAERPVPARSGADAAIVRQPGFQTPVAWSAQPAGDLPERIRLRVFFEGARRTDIRLSAIYMQP